MRRLVAIPDDSATGMTVVEASLAESLELESKVLAPAPTCMMVAPAPSSSMCFLEPMPR